MDNPNIMVKYITNTIKKKNPEQPNKKAIDFQHFYNQINPGVIQ